MTYLTIPQVLIPAFAGMTEEGKTAQGNLNPMSDLLPRGVGRAEETVELGRWRYARHVSSGSQPSRARKPAMVR